MRKILSVLFIYCIFPNYSHANCYSAALAAAIGSQNEFAFKYESPYGRNRFWYSKTENVVFIQINGTCDQDDADLLTVKVGFNELEPSCSAAKVLSVECRYLP